MWHPDSSQGAGTSHGIRTSQDIGLGRPLQRPALAPDERPSLQIQGWSFCPWNVWRTGHPHSTPVSSSKFGTPCCNSWTPKMALYDPPPPRVSRGWCFGSPCSSRTSRIELLKPTTGARAAWLTRRQEAREQTGCPVDPSGCPVDPKMPRIRKQAWFLGLWMSMVYGF